MCLCVYASGFLLGESKKTRRKEKCHSSCRFLLAPFLLLFPVIGVRSPAQTRPNYPQYVERESTFTRTQKSLFLALMFSPICHKKPISLFSYLLANQLVQPMAHLQRACVYLSTCLPPFPHRHFGFGPIFVIFLSLSHFKMRLKKNLSI